jgi:hypothetical protein
LSHSHLAVRHLIRQLEIRGRSRPSTLAAPQWLAEFLNAAAEAFEPFEGEARVGYECRLADDGWETTLFLGRQEIVGGPHDGEQRAVDFRFDLQPVLTAFDRVDSLSWHASPERADSENEDGSFLEIAGAVGGEPLRLQVLSAAPASVKSAMRVYADGRCELS